VLINDLLNKNPEIKKTYVNFSDLRTVTKASDDEMDRIMDDFWE